MGVWIELKPEGADTIRAWRADPAGKPRGGIVVVQEIFGVNAHIRATADRFAAEGYLAIAPAIFDHVERGFDVGYDAQARARGMAIGGKADFEQILRDVAAAIGVAKEGGKVGIVGYCLGGSVAWAAAARLSGLSAAVGYYGGRVVAMKTSSPASPPCCTSARRTRIFQSPACAKSPPLTRTSRFTPTPPNTASTAISARVTTRRAPRWRGRGLWSSSPKIWGKQDSGLFDSAWELLQRAFRAPPECSRAP